MLLLHVLLCLWEELRHCYLMTRETTRVNIMKVVKKCVFPFNHADIPGKLWYFKLYMLSFLSSSRGGFCGRPEKRLFKLNLLEIKGWIDFFFPESCLDLNALILAVFKNIVEFVIDLMWVLEFVPEPIQQCR